MPPSQVRVLLVQQNKGRIKFHIPPANTIAHLFLSNPFTNHHLSSIIQLDLGRVQAKLSTLGKQVMTGKVVTNFPPAHSPILQHQDNYDDADARPSPPLKGSDVSLPAPAMSRTKPMPVPVVRALEDAHSNGHHHFDYHGLLSESLPPYSMSHPSTAPGSPRTL